MSLLFALMMAGCAGYADFASVLPPQKSYPEAGEYEQTTAVKGTLQIKKSFRGNSTGGVLYLFGDLESSNSFTVGEQGYVTFYYQNLEITWPAEIIESQGTGQGTYRAAYSTGNQADVPNHFPGTFWILIKEIPDCIMLNKKAVTITGIDNTAIVHLLNDDGTIADKEITVGDSNTEYYEITSGLNEGDKVIMG